MAETVEQYVERILSNVDQDPLSIQSATKRNLEQLVASVSGENLKRRLSPERWSIAEIAAHLADAEVVAAFRIRKIVSEPGCALAAFDQDAWAKNLNYEERDTAQSVEDFGRLRDMNLALLRKLTADEWERHGIHAERGKETLRRVVELYAGHDINHLRQIGSVVKDIQSEQAA
jgi:hypothetical protein